MIRAPPTQLAHLGAFSTHGPVLDRSFLLSRGLLPLRAQAGACPRVTSNVYSVPIFRYVAYARTRIVARSFFNRMVRVGVNRLNERL